MKGLGLVCTTAVSHLLAQSAYSLGDVIDCGDKSEDIEAAANVIVNNWDDSRDIYRSTNRCEH